MISELNLGEGERLPWLETAADHDERQRRSWSIVLAVLGGVALLLLVLAGIWYAQRGGSATGHGELIAAPAGPYKERADGKDGLSVGTDSDAMLAASDGREVRARIATADQPTAIDRAPPVNDTAAVGGTGSGTTPAAPRTSNGAAVQLGALNDRALAEAQWTKFTVGQPALKGLNHSVEEVQSGGKTVFRLRAAVADGKEGQALCRTLIAANVPCFVVR